ncbi:MAG: NUDIX domain-containing protein, partial [Muribaculaceae bacterium]|nr:NUDIX domain-containing protein [Muribaculaceae bacterium]
MTDMNENEVFPIVDSNGCVTGKATRRECHCGSMLLHPVVHMHIIDHEGNIFLQRRSDNKDIQPGRWDTAVGGHIDFGESVGEALKRETKEE